jgi:hypothetical protein
MDGLDGGFLAWGGVFDFLVKYLWGYLGLLVTRDVSFLLIDFRRLD